MRLLYHLWFPKPHAHISYSQYFHIVFQLTSYDIDIPNDIEGKKIVKLTRKATNWGPDYLFHSCADVEFVKLSVSKY